MALERRLAYAALIPFLLLALPILPSDSPSGGGGGGAGGGGGGGETLDPPAAKYVVRFVEYRPADEHREYLEDGLRGPRGLPRRVVAVGGAAEPRRRVPHRLRRARDPRRVPRGCRRRRQCARPCPGRARRCELLQGRPVCGSAAAAGEAVHSHVVRGGGRRGR